jgi:hypothetical protein
MKTIDTISLKINSSRPVFIHVLIGAVVGYFLLHPVSMVIYWFEFNDAPVLIPQLIDVFLDRLSYAFNLQMFPMALAFAVLGALLGLGPGLFVRSLRIKQYKILGSEKLLQKSIPSLINEGENEFVEFRPSLRYDYRQVKTDKNIEEAMLKCIAGFLNAGGGVILIGVKNTGEVRGLDNDYWSLKNKNSDGFQRRLISIISNRLGRDICVKVHISFHWIEFKEICSLFIEPSHRPVYLQEGNLTVFYLRTGTITNSLTTSETVEYLKTRNKT